MLFLYFPRLIYETVRYSRHFGLVVYGLGSMNFRVASRRAIDAEADMEPTFTISRVTARYQAARLVAFNTSSSDTVHPRYVPPLFITASSNHTHSTSRRSPLYISARGCLGDTPDPPWHIWAVVPQRMLILKLKSRASVGNYRYVVKKYMIVNVLRLGYPT